MFSFFSQEAAFDIWTPSVSFACSFVHIVNSKTFWTFFFVGISDHYILVNDLYVCFFRGFKALKQTVKLYYRLGKYELMMQAYREMLTYIKSAVTRNYSEKCINSIMDFVSGSASQNFGLLQEFYQTTLKALEEAKNEVGGHLILVHSEFWGVQVLNILLSCCAETVV